MFSVLSFANVVLAVAAIAWAVVRQFMTAPVGAFRLRVFVVLGAVGLWQVARLVDAGGLSAADGVALVVSLASAAGFGWLRGRSARVWAHDGVVYRRGGWPVVALWAAGLAVHVGIDVAATVADGAHGLGQMGAASIMLYLAVTLGAQALVVSQRAQHARGTEASPYEKALLH
ncbi:hypothetical protein SCMU_15180 [Sinomonas cyclohexanicum]|uniref:DUF1453 domain-containing protein n=1 Tax=Sinomonas cyclohexanicum TaxID=322009 RepID=A0ABM7PTW8_SINCY|nr:hypothetical protein [Corynebacterium cyclohexanicum]BCT75676.1 hypothetical protein SCMU_15180 [Corynebacterium cyclohexanicum]